MVSMQSYRSKVAGVWILLAFSCLLAYIAALALRGQDPALSHLLRSLATAVALAFVCMAVPCRYTLRAEGLSVQAGFFIRHIPYAHILEATPAQGWSWAPALSSDRVLLRCAHGDLWVSPVRQREFLADLRERLPARQAEPVAR